MNTNVGFNHVTHALLRLATVIMNTQVAERVQQAQVVELTSLAQLIVYLKVIPLNIIFTAYESKERTKNYKSLQLWDKSLFKTGTYGSSTHSV